MDVVIIIPCVGEPIACATVDAALVQHAAPRVVLCGKAPEGIRPHERLTLLDAATALPPGLARNLGVKRAGNFDVAVFLDADAVPEPGWLDAVLARMREGHELVGGAIRLCDQGYFFRADQTTCFYDQLENAKSGTVSTLTATNLAVTRSLWQTAGPFPDNATAGEDLEFVLRCRKAGAQPWLESGAIVTHRPGPVNLRRMWRHAGHWGKESIHVRMRHRDILPTPAWMMRPWSLALLAPFVGPAFAFHQLSHTPHPYRDWRLWPAMAVAKTVWCLAAAKSLYVRGRVAATTTDAEP